MGVSWTCRGVVDVGALDLVRSSRWGALDLVRGSRWGALDLVRGSRWGCLWYK